MISIGNDIVDLSSVDIERSNNIKFYSKFVTAPELALYHLSAKAKMPFESFVWLLWSVKESAYKYLRRHQVNLVFSPGKIIVQQLNIPLNFFEIDLKNPFWEDIAGSDTRYTGEVIIDDVTLHFKSIIQTEFIATIVSIDPNFDNVHWGISTIEETGYATQSNSVRMLALSKLKSVFPAARLTIQKNAGGVPIVLNDGKEANMMLSLSHHNHFISCMFKAV